MIVEPSADLGKLDASLIPMKKLCASFLLKILNCNGKGALCDVQLFGSTPEMKLLGQNAKILKLLQIHAKAPMTAF